MMQLLQQARHAISVAIGRLSPREQRLVAVLGVLMALAILYVGMIEPIVGARGRTEKRITQLSNDIAEMSTLAKRIALLEPQVGADADTATTDADFSLFSFMDRATSGVGKARGHHLDEPDPAPGARGHRGNHRGASPDHGLAFPGRRAVA